MKKHFPKIFWEALMIIFSSTILFTGCSIVNTSKESSLAFESGEKLSAGLSNNFATFISTKVNSLDDEEIILNLYDLDNNKLFYSKVLEKAALNSSKNYRYGEVFLGEGFNLMLLDVQQGNYQVIMNDGKLIKKLGEIKAAENIQVYGDKLICTSYGLEGNKSKAFITSYKLSKDKLLLDKQIAISGNPTDLKVDTHGNVYVAAYDFNNQNTLLYHFNIEDYKLSEETIFNYPASCKLALTKGEILVGCNEKVSEDTKASKEPINKIYVKRKEGNLEELYNLKDFSIYDIMADQNKLYVVDSPNNPSIYTLDLDSKNKLQKDNLGFDNYYGMKAVKNRIYFFGEKEITVLENGMNKIIYKDNSMPGTISLKIR